MNPLPVTDLNISSILRCIHIQLGKGDIISLTRGQILTLLTYLQIQQRKEEENALPHKVPNN